MGLMKGHCRCWCWNPAPVNLDHCSLWGFLNQSSKSLWCQSSPPKNSHQKKKVGRQPYIYLSKFSNKNIIFTKIHKPILGCSTTQKNHHKNGSEKFQCWKKPWLVLRVLELNYMWSSQQRFFQPPPWCDGFCRKLVWLMKGLGTWGGFSSIGSLGASRNKKMNMCSRSMGIFSVSLRYLEDDIECKKKALEGMLHATSCYLHQMHVTCIKCMK